MVSFEELDRKLSDSDKPGLAVLPVGCYEQHGPVLPLATDNLIAQGAAERLSRRLEARYTCHVFPCLPYTTTEPNVNYAGTVSVAADPFRAYLQQVCAGIMKGPFSALLILNSHGSIVGSLKEVAFGLVMSQYRDPSLSRVRPVLALNVFDFDQQVATEFDHSPGRHADWKEFLLLYDLMGDDYFTESRMARLREFQRENRFDQVMPGVIGIPAELRTTLGVQGDPLPLTQEYASAAERVWEITLSGLETCLIRELERFEQHYAQR